MRIPCPHCGERDAQEFTYRGAAEPVRPELDSDPALVADAIYLRDNPAGPLREHWHHVFGCRAWLIVTRDTRTHAIAGAVAARDVSAGAKEPR